MARVKCVTVIDEADAPSQAYQDQQWATFKTDYPEREFWLLAPRPAYTNQMRLPTLWPSDPLAFGDITVTRDNGSVANRSDWFAICNFDELPPGAICSVAIDTSGSMRLSTVQASYNYFIERCAAAQITIVFDTRFPSERWIDPHLQPIAPSVTIFANPSSYQLGSANAESVISWDVFGDFTSATITATQGGQAAPNEDIGEVAGPGSTTVSPTQTTVYTITAVGPAGNNSREVTLTVEIPDPPTVSFTVDPESYINPGSATLEWSVSGVLIDEVSINQGIGVVGVTGNAVVQPTFSTIYTITATNPGGSTTKSVTVTVYQPVGVNIFASPNPISVGQIATLSWDVSGDADTASIDQGIGTVLFNSTTQVSPSTSTTYTLSASGPGGSDSEAVTVAVCQTPELSASFPTQIQFGLDFTADIEYRYASGGIVIDIEYQSAYGVLDTEQRTIAGTDSDDSGTSITEVFNSAIPWDITGDDAGPAIITYTIKALQSTPCSGETVVGPFTTTVVIDKLADNINIPDSLNQLPAADPVISPDEDTVLSDPIEITDIDINVEIKADKPIQVRFDEADPNIESSWKSLRQIT
jgi:hypothetical protein